MGYVAKPLWVLALAALTAAAMAPARAGQSAPQINLRNIAAVCSGLQSLSASGGRGKVSSAGGYDFEVADNKELQITQSG